MQAQEEGGASLLPVEAQQKRSKDDDAAAVDWVNSTVRDPMVEVDPVTVFRRIAAERRASLAMAVAEEKAALLVWTTSPPPFFPSSKRPSNFTIPITTALVLLAVAAAVHFFRSGKNREARSKLPLLTDGNNALGPFIDGRRKLAKDTIKASQSVLVAMKIGTASLGRPKRYSDPNHETSHTVYDNGAVEKTNKVEDGTDLNLISNIVVTEDTKSDSNGSSCLQQTPSCFNSVEDFSPFKGQNADVDDVTEGPWFGQAAVETAKPISAEKGMLEYEAVCVQSQGYPFTNETLRLQVVEHSVSTMTVSDVLTEPWVLTSDEVNMVDGEFFGEVLAVNTATALPVEPNHVGSWREKPKSEEMGSDLAQPNPPDNGMNIEKTEQIMEQDLIGLPGSEDLTDDTLNLNVMPETNEAKTEGQCLDEGLIVVPSDLHLVNSQIKQTISDIELDTIKEYYATGQLSSIDQTGQITVNQFLRIDQGGDQRLDLTPESHDVTHYASHQEPNEVLQGHSLNQELGDIFDSEDLTENSLEVGQAKGGVIDRQSFNQGDKQLTEHTVSNNQIDHQDSAELQSHGNIPVQLPPDVGNLLPALKTDCPAPEAVEKATDKVSKRDSNKTLEAVVPALTIGVGAIGTLFGVAGGLQVVGFAALASLISRDLFWAQSRVSLWQELSSITDRQKLLDFLAKRNIVKRK